MPTAKALDKKWLMKDIERDHRAKARRKLVELRAQLRTARAERKAAMARAKETCRVNRLSARERARGLRIRGLAELREAGRLEREAARDVCNIGKQEAKSKDGVERQRAALLAEKNYQAQLRRIDRGNKERRREHPHATYIERRSESDDEVRFNISPELVSLFERVKRGIKATPRMSRTEAFLKYAEEHPDEVLAGIDEKTDALIRDLERQEREAHRALHRRAPRPRYVPEARSEVPF